ncbi:photosynthetic reaction center subunit H [Phenylobacterium sp.]|uniref:photosynthetic reaction center subunit H n=1 Tax=Phenylobacterium sp. TaxID=1871053 RepID=UPI0025E0EF91|nr:photosynthetic reaction center subunit H [Phenylobacterium sp.]
MHNLFFFGNVDVTEIILSAFVLFFVALIIYLRREDRREGYPLEEELSGRLEPGGGLLFAARPKTFILPHAQGTLAKPNSLRESQDLAARRTSRASGSPLEPTGDPMQAGVGPGSYARRAHKPDLTLHGAPKIVPLRIAEGFSLESRDPDPRGMTVIGADRVAGGVVTDVWVDRAEYMIRYLEVAVTPAPGAAPAAVKHVLVPMTMAVIMKSKGTVRVDAIFGAQFAGAPTLENPDQITLFEEERVCAYYGGGFLYASKMRTEPWL